MFIFRPIGSELWPPILPQLSHIKWKIWTADCQSRYLPPAWETPLRRDMLPNGKVYGFSFSFLGRERGDCVIYIFSFFLVFFFSNESDIPNLPIGDEKVCRSRARCILSGWSPEQVLNFKVPENFRTPERMAKQSLKTLYMQKQ